MSAPNPVGFTSQIDCFGDSLTQGAGGNGQGVPFWLSTYLPGRIVNNWGIGGQTAAQVAARQGGRPATLAVSGGQLGATFAATAVTPSVQMLSTPADNTTRYISGQVAGVPLTLSRTATGGPPSTSETYTAMSAGNPAAVAVPATAPFYTDQGFNARDAVQVLWPGRNDLADLSGIPGLVSDCIDYVHDPRRIVVIGILPGTSEINGDSTRNNINATNVATTATATAKGAVYVQSTAPTAAELAAVGYSPTSGDNTQIAAGVFPDGLRSDSSGNRIHLTAAGYQIFALRVAAAIKGQGW